MPTFDKGWLFFLAGRNTMAVYGPDGVRRPDLEVRRPDGGAVSILTAAVDSIGVIAVSASYSTPQGYAAGLFYFDGAGKQIRFVSTGRFLPADLCFDRKDSLWAFGWQRGAADNAREDTEDYATARRYSKEGKETGAFLPRSLFPARVSPFGAHGGLWLARASHDRIGMLAYPYQAEFPPEWVELDLDGNLAGRWPIGKRADGGMAYTSSGDLYVSRSAPKRRTLSKLDTSSGAWTEVPLPFGGSDVFSSLLLGADGNRLVFAAPGGLEYRYFPVP